MKQKQYLILMGWVYALMVGAIILLIAFNTDEIDTFGQVFAIAFILFFAYRSYSSFETAKLIREEDRIYAPPSDATVDEEISYYKNILLIGGISILALSIWTYIDVTTLEAGVIESVRVFGPIAFIYEMSGFWAAVLTLPIIGILAILSLMNKIRLLKQYKDLVKP